MTAIDPPDGLLSQQSSIDIEASADILNEPLSDSFLESLGRSFPRSPSQPIAFQQPQSPGGSVKLDEDEDDLYFIPAAHGTLAPITKDQEHYDSRKGDDDFKKLDFCDDLVGREEELQLLWEAFHGKASDDGAAGLDAKDECSVEGSPKRIVFLKGYSGVGKSTLVRHFVTQVKARINVGACSGRSHIFFGSGKFNDSGIPFSAFGELFQRLIEEITSAKLLDRIQTAVANSPDIGKDTEGCKVLRETWPVLSALLDGPNTSGESEKRKLKRADSAFNLVGSTITMNSIKEHTLTLLDLLSSEIDNERYAFTFKTEEPSQTAERTRRHPVMIVFLDDLQWADSPSLDLLTHLLSESRFLNIMFICAYRSNEVDENHPLQRVIDEATSRTINSSDRSLMSDKEGSGIVDNTYQLELYPLSPTSIQQFIATTLDKEKTDEDITNLSEVVIKKTMGNIFYVKQALEELVRKNALYYDMMCFEWLFTNSRDSELLGEYISDDVVSSVRGKIGMLDVKLQLILTVMSHIPKNTIDTDILLELVLSTGTEMSLDELVMLLKVGVNEGMLLLSSQSGHYIFAHDRIRQASKECVEGESRDKMLLQLANVLSAMYKEDQSDTEWCIYVAVDFLNTFEPGAKSDALDLARLNMKVSRCAHAKGAVDKEYELLGHGLNCLKSAEKVWEEYHLTLDLYNNIMEAAQILGKFDESSSYVKEVLNHARNLDDKLVAYRHQITLTHVETRDYSKTLHVAVEVLEIYGYEFPAIPTATECMKEEMKVKLALHNRPFSCLVDQPFVEIPMMELFKYVTQYALVSGNDRLLKIISWKAIRLGLQKGIDHNFHTILVCLGNTMAKEKEIKTAFEIVNTAMLISERSREDKGNYAYTQLVAYQGVLFQRQSFRSGVDMLLQCYKDLKLDGQVDPALGSALGHFLAIFATGITIGPLVESKLILVEEFAKKSSMVSFVALFQMQRQFMLNLWKKSENPTELAGFAFDETEFLSSLDRSSKVYSMTLRDTSTFRLILAFVYRDHGCMASMLNILRDYPMTDMAIPRLHLRLGFMGLSALYLIQQSKKNKRFEDIAKSCVGHFKELTKLGSVNAKPVYHFLLAMKQPSIKTFELAISSCADAQFPHLEAMAKEHYGLFLCRDSDNVSIGQDYLVSAYWLYCNWGAHGKTSRMQEEHTCIKTASKNQANSRIEKALSSHSGSTNQKDTAGPGKLKRFSLQVSFLSRRPKTVATRRQSKSCRNLFAGNV